MRWKKGGNGDGGVKSEKNKKKDKKMCMKKRGFDGWPCMLGKASQQAMQLGNGSWSHDFGFSQSPFIVFAPMAWLVNWSGHSASKLKWPGSSPG